MFLIGVVILAAILLMTVLSPIIVRTDYTQTHHRLKASTFLGALVRH